MKQQRNYSSSVTRRSTTTSMRTYGGRRPAPRCGGSPSALRGAAAHVVRSSNPRTQAVGVTIAVAGACYGLAKLGLACLDIISGNSR